MEVDIEKKRNRDILCIESGLDKQFDRRKNKTEIGYKK